MISEKLVKKTAETNLGTRPDVKNWLDDAHVHLCMNAHTHACTHTHTKRKWHLYYCKVLIYWFLHVNLYAYIYMPDTLL